MTKKIIVFCPECSKENSFEKDKIKMEIFCKQCGILISDTLKQYYAKLDFKIEEV